MCVLSAGCCSAQVLNAAIDNVTVDPQHQTVHFDIRNLGTQTITAFFARLTQLQSDGSEVQCNAGGQDMIDWPMRRQWIAPGGTLHTARYFGTCKDTGAASDWRLKLTAIVFEDGSGEGEQGRREIFVGMRRQVRDVRVKWIGRFTALRTADDLHAAASQLYQDLESAKHALEMTTDAVEANRLAVSELDKLRELALQLAGIAQTPNPRADRIISDLEERTERLVHGSS